MSSDFSNIIFLILAGIIFFSPLLQTTGIFSGGALAQYYFPERIKTYLDFIEGQWPGWDPRLGLGVPTDLTNRYFSLLYPFNLTFFFLDPAIAFNLSRFIHQLLALLFMYLMLRGLRVAAAGALVGSLVYGFGGFFLANIWSGHLAELNSLTYLPLIFLCGLRAFRGSWRYLGIGLILMFVQAWAGSIQLTSYQFLVLAAEALWVTGETKKLRPIIIYLIWLVVGLLLCAPYWLPMVYQLIALDMPLRPPVVAGVGQPAAFQPLMWLMFIWPHLFGSVTEFSYWLTPYPWGVGAGLGMTTAFLALMGARRTHRGLFFLALAVVFGILAMSEYNWLNKLIRFIPFIGNFAVPLHAMGIVHFAVAALAGMGWERLAWEDSPRRARFVLRILGGVTLVVPLALALITLLTTLTPLIQYRLNLFWLGWVLGAMVFIVLTIAMTRGILRGRHWGAVILLCLLLAELAFYNARFLQMLPKDSFATKYEWRGLNAWSGDRWQGRLRFGQTGISPELYSHAWPALDGCWFATENFPGSPSSTSFVKQELRDAEDEISSWQPTGAYCSLRGIILDEPAAGRQKLPGSLLSLAGPGIRFIDELYISPPPLLLPLAFITGKVTEVSPVELPNAMATLDYFIGEVIITQPLPQTIAVDAVQNGEFLILAEHRDDYYRWDAQLMTPGFLFFSMRYHPDWQVLVDGKGVELYRANIDFMGVPLDPGEHQVEFIFTTPARKWAWSLFVLGLLLTMYILAGRRESFPITAHSIYRPYQRWLVVGLLAILFVGTRWQMAGQEMYQQMSRTVLTSAEYKEMSAAYQRRGNRFSLQHRSLEKLIKVVADDSNIEGTNG